MPVTNELLNTEDAAEFLTLSPDTLRLWRQHGRGPAYSRLGSRVVYELIELRQFVAKHRRPAVGTRRQRTKVTGK